MAVLLELVPASKALRSILFIKGSLISAKTRLSWFHEDAWSSQIEVDLDLISDPPVVVSLGFVAVVLSRVLLAVSIGLLPNRTALDEPFILKIRGKHDIVLVAVPWKTDKCVVPFV